MSELAVFSSIEFYNKQVGEPAIDVRIEGETVWLSLNQLSILFERDKSVIAKHIKRIYADEELERNSVVAFFATTASDGKTYQVEHFNLDMILSVGYRVNSKQGTLFRQWTTKVLTQHLVQGFNINEERLRVKGMGSLQQAITLLESTLLNNELVNEVGAEAIRLITRYAKTWELLLAYDEDRLALPTMQKVSEALSYEKVITAIASLKSALTQKNEATELFGRERESSLSSILANLEQTFGGEPLYRTPDEKAAHLLYFVIKDHPFIDGNKRIGSFLFLLYLEHQKLPIRLEENGLVALALLIAESAPNQKDILIRLVV
ncbi:MAG: virulence RhuM family protein, partial [Gammaproteobacteria bacterium]|nr:virulence RhuM family protein [Gammaproteobacteria bacterium]